MFDFSHIAPVKTVPLSLGDSVRSPSTNPKPVSLQVRYAGDGNIGYVNARAKAPMPPDEDGKLKRLAKLFAHHVIVGWENVGDADGAAVAFSRDACEKLLLALIAANCGHIVRYIMAFCLEASNFHEPVEDPVELGKG